jgi:uncharacterized protein (TIGR03066 family)
MKTKKQRARDAAKQAQKPGVPKSATGALPARRFLGLPKWIVILVAIALVAGASFAAFELLLPGRIPPEVVGQWRVVGGPTDGMTLDFRRDGTMIGKATIDGKEGIIEGTALVTGNTLRTTTTNPYTRKAETGIQTIVTLTQTEFVTEDQKGKRISMVRAR